MTAQPKQRGLYKDLGNPNVVGVQGADVGSVLHIPEHYYREDGCEPPFEDLPSREHYEMTRKP